MDWPLIAHCIRKHPDFSHFIYRETETGRGKIPHSHALWKKTEVSSVLTPDSTLLFMIVHRRPSMMLRTQSIKKLFGRRMNECMNTMRSTSYKCFKNSKTGEIISLNDLLNIDLLSIC